ncbi:(Fe-S)-binding protein [bacterium]|nr:(Fe-S)-binding protein [bacterium]
MPTEQIILGLSGTWWLRGLMVISVGMFAWRLSRLLGVLRLGRADNRFGQLGLRLRTFLKEVMGQSRMFREPIIGWAHPLVFWGFCAFGVASTLMWIGGMFPQWHVPQAEEIPVLGTVVDVFALVVLIGLITALFRRYVLRPPGLQLTTDALIVLLAIGILMVTFLFAEAGGHGEGRQTWLPVGSAVAAGLAALGLAESSIAGIGVAAWWIHAVIILAFVALILFSKHMHLVWAPFAVLFAELPQKGALPAPPEAEGQESPDELGLFTWRMLLNAYTCAECGRCERACPAFASGAKLSPRELVHRFKEYVLEHGLAAPKPAGNGNGSPSLTGGLIPAEMLWGCTTCYACMEQCPVRNEHVPLIVTMRRKLVEEGAVDAKLQEALTSLQRYGNSFGKSDRARAKWTQGLPAKIKDARKEPVEYLWYVGDYASYDPRVQPATRSLAAIWQQAGVDFGILYEGERNTGADVRRVGEEGLFEMLQEKNQQALGKAQFQKLLTTDPHSYHALKAEYGQNGHGVSVLHYSELLDALIRDGKLTPRRKLDLTVTYHDPCYLGRYNGVYEAPRRVLRALGVNLVELPRNRATSFCCGAGGGKIWMEEEEGITERPAVNRMREALALDGVTQVAVACPKDLVMFQDALKTAGLEDKLVVRDLTELVAEALEPAGPDQSNT